MDVDNSSRFRQPTQYQQGQPQRQTPNPNNTWQQEQNNQTNSYNSFEQTNKRPNSGTARFTVPKEQRINHLAPEEDFTNQEDTYQTEAELEAEDIDDERRLPCVLCGRRRRQQGHQHTTAGLNPGASKQAKKKALD